MPRCAKGRCGLWRLRYEILRCGTEGRENSGEGRGGPGLGIIVIRGSCLETTPCLQVASLRQAVQAGCDERRDLQQQLSRALAVASESPSSPAGGVGGPVMTMKPLPRGPISKPKFR